MRSTLVEGSVRVSIGGTTLTENQDYRVDYNSGSNSDPSP